MVGGYKIVSVNGTKYEYPVSALEVFTDSVADKFGVKLSSKTELNNEGPDPQGKWEFEKTGKLSLPTKEILAINYTSDIEKCILDMRKYAKDPTAFYESHRFRILNRKEMQKEAVAITRRSDHKEYDLLYVFENAKDYIKAGSNIGFKKAFDALFDDKAVHRRYCGKGKSSSKSINLTSKEQEMIFLLYERILKQHA